MFDRKEYFKKYREEHREIINKKARETYYKNKEERPEYEKQRRREWSNNKRKKDKENVELVIKQKEVLDKIKEYCNHKLEMLELQKRNIMQILTPENGYLKTDIEIEMQKYKDILELLEEIE